VRGVRADSRARVTDDSAHRVFTAHRTRMRVRYEDRAVVRT